MNTNSTHSLANSPTPLSAVLLASFFISMGTGVFWNGLSFIAKQRYDFSEQKNFILFAVMGVVYTIGALKAGSFTRIVERRISPRGLLLVVVLMQAMLCLVPVLFRSEWALWCAAIGVTYTASLAWPLMESYLTSGRHGQDMRSAIGWFNVIWTAAVCVPLFFMPLVLEEHGEWAIGGLAFINLIGLIPLWWFAAKPGHHDAELSKAHQSDEYPLLLRSARVLLPLSYVLMSAMTPILPYRLDEIGVEVKWMTPATATWMVVRFFTVFVMWRLKFWHGRWGVLLLAGLTMTGGFGLVVLAPGVVSMLCGFVVYGIGMGVVYYAALYYGMAVGQGEIDAGGKHEALIGAGYGVGPMAGVASTYLAGDRGANVVGANIVGMTMGIMAIGAVPAVLPYVKARRARKSPVDGIEQSDD